MSIRYAGVANRSFIIGSSECPPARMRASGPSWRSSVSACSTLAARSYSNGAGTCTASFPMAAWWPVQGGSPNLDPLLHADHSAHGYDRAQP